MRVTLYSFLKNKVEWAFGKCTCLSAFLKIPYLKAVVAFIWGPSGEGAGEELTQISEEKKGPRKYKHCICSDGIFSD
jgi:hypothetical protein